MKIHKDIKIELAASKDSDRHAIGEPFLDIKHAKGTVVATDGRILAMIPVEIETGDDPGYIPADTLKAARKLALRSEIAFFTAGPQIKLPNGDAVSRIGNNKPGDGYPNWRAVIPDGSEHTQVIAIDAKRLWLLAQAMGTQCVKLRIKDDVSPLLVEPQAAGRHSDAAKPVHMDARGVIMPVKLSE